MKKLKQPSLASLNKRLWKAFSLFIRQRDNYTCISCGGTDRSQMQCGHGLPSKVYGWLLRYDEVNNNCQCFYCNIFAEGAGFHYYRAIVKKYGQERVEQLFMLIPESKAFKPDRKWFEEKIAYYEDQNRVSKI